MSAVTFSPSPLSEAQIQTIRSRLSESRIQSRQLDNLRNGVIKQIAKKTLQEFAVSLALTALGCLFVASSAAVTTLVTASLSMVLINTVFRACSGYFYYQKENPHNSADVRAISEKRYAKLQFLSPICFANHEAANSMTIIHEAGHAVAASSLFKNASPKITLIPFKGGTTSFYTSALTTVGEYLGKDKARLLVAGAGPAAAIGASLTGIALSHKTRSSHPEVSRYLLCLAIMTIFNHVIYALSALTWDSKDLSHDFVSLWIGGIHPIVSAITMVALPIMLKFGLHYVENKHRAEALLSEQPLYYEPQLV